MDMSIGEYLSSVRNEKNLTLEEISEITKIKVRILEAIEADKFDDLGGLGYVKALLITYAKAINADKAKVLQMIDQNYKGIQLNYSRPLPEQSPKKYLFHMNLIYVILLVLLIAVLTFFTVRLYREGKLNSPFFKIFERQKPVDSEVLIDSLNSETDEELIEPDISAFDPDALHDTTNYTSELLFKSQANPYEYQK